MSQFCSRQHREICYQHPPKAEDIPAGLILLVGQDIHWIASTTKQLRRGLAVYLSVPAMLSTPAMLQVGQIRRDNRINIPVRRVREAARCSFFYARALLSLCHPLALCQAMPKSGRISLVHARTRKKIGSIHYKLVNLFNKPTVFFIHIPHVFRCTFQFFSCLRNAFPSNCNGDSVFHSF